MRVRRSIPGTTKKGHRSGQIEAWLEFQINKDR